MAIGIVKYRVAETSSIILAEYLRVLLSRWAARFV